MGSKNILALTNGKVLTPLRLIDRGTVLIKGDSISEVGSAGEVKIPESAKIYDAAGKYISPGFIDIHVHGGGGGDASEGTCDSIHTMAKAHAAGGTTSLLATTFTAPIEEIGRASCRERV